MKLIIDIEDTNYKYLNELAQQDNTTVENIINDMIQTHIVSVNESYRDVNKEELSDFSRVVQRYFHEDLESMYDVLGSDEQLITDKPMINVYKKLYQDVALRNGIALELFNEYKKATQ
ncbi:TPA: hypothetical protein ACJHHF_001879 [Staphylococcus pseudintermedius]|uniref:hypothetical protein n=1 Tax=Staphylococcus pseudintermedius TaxID=283734 RepID=UPI002562D9D5|nr:hypothetical protein [Staphylococcus pseudintermedius]EJO7204230.1 hypothetical protein [Staphylococcus pseudintermedius]MDK3675420.1 hypothetical protein [Staphylococcus pseudintermedius]HCG2148672.1 hypothetical protein [Staphylococcus pseudintermedius]